MSNTNRVGVRLVRESAYGVVPTGPSLLQLPVTGAPDLAFTPETIVSELIRSDRQIDDLILVGSEAAGSLPSEFAYGVHDTLIEGAFFNLFQTRFVRRNNEAATQITGVNGTTETISFTAYGPTTGSITVDFAAAGDTITRATGSFLTDGFAAGDRVIISGAVDAGNNAIHQIVSVTDLVMTVGNTITDETADAGVTITKVWFSAKDIVRAEGFTNAANNGYLIAGTQTAAGTLVVTNDLVTETPPSGAVLHLVGRRGEDGDLALTISGSTGTLVSSSGTNFTYLGLAKGDWVKLAGFVATAANNEYYRLSADPSATTLTFDRVPVGSASETPAGAVDVYLGERVVNGTLELSHSLEIEYADHSPVTYQYFRGMMVDTMSLSAEPQAIAGVSFEFQGKDAFFSDSNTPASVPSQLPAVSAGRVGSATLLSSGTVNVLNTSSNVARIARGGTPISSKNFVLEASIEIANNLRQREAVGFLGAVSVGVGEFSLSGTLNTYFDDASLARDVVANSETSLDLRFRDGSGHVMLFDMPRIKFSEGAPEVPGKNQDVTLNLSYQAIRHAAFDYTVKCMRFHGAQ